MEDKLKIIVTSDLHGNLPVITENFDLLLICGDVCPAHDHYFSFQDEWIRNDFVEWINNLPFNNVRSRVVMVWGNHDFVGERYHDLQLFELSRLTDSKLVVLKNGTYDFEYLSDNIVKKITIFGTSYCKIFGNWAFMVSNDKLKEKYSKCPDNIDIFISHDSPSINDLGKINEGSRSGIDAGNAILDDIILEKKPKYFFSGHIHSGNHNFEKVGETYMANVSYIDERYKPSYNILKFFIDER